MRVALDATPLSVSTGGIARYTAELAYALAREFSEDEYLLVSDQPVQYHDAGTPNLHLSPRSPDSLLRRRWWSSGLPRELLKLDMDVFHGTDFAVPYLPIRPSVMTLHDLSPWRDPAWHSDADRIRQRTPWLIRLGLASMIITPTESIRREAIAAFQLHPDRVVATPLAPAARFCPSPQPPAAIPYFLYVGVLEPRKNIPLLIEAWREVRKQHPVDLVLAGRPRRDFQVVGMEPGLQVLGEVPEDDLPRWYSGALAFLFPSFYEGFGLPVLEAMACGATALISTDGALMEVAGDGALALDPASKKAWTEAMLRVINQPEWLAEMRAKALCRARQFSWAATARKTRAVYEEARRRFGS